MPNPFLDREPLVAVRDPATIFHDGVYRCFHTAVERRGDRYALFVDVTQSRDLETWSPPRRLADDDLNFSSPGNVIWYRDRWILCVQSYPVKAGESHGSDESRLWLMESFDLDTWSEPRRLQAEGCQAEWAKSRRQIDPYLIEHNGQFWCFYKTDGQLGLLVSDDLKMWREASPTRPVLSAGETPDGSTLENPCVICDNDEFRLFFAPCRAGRGIGVARSRDLLHWSDVRYLDFPPLPWASGGPTAAMVLDTRAERGEWTMFFHGDRKGPHDAALGIAWNTDLEQWHF